MTIKKLIPCTLTAAVIASAALTGCSSKEYYGQTGRWPGRKTGGTVSTGSQQVRKQHLF